MKTAGATTTINGDNSVTLRSRTGQFLVTVTAAEWQERLAQCEAEPDRVNHQSAEQRARASFLDAAGAIWNSSPEGGSIGAGRRRLDAEIDRCLQGCPEQWREPARICAREFLLSGASWEIEIDGLAASETGATMDWRETARVGVMYLSHGRTLDQVGPGPNAEAIDRRLASENGVSHDIALRLMDRADYREHRAQFDEMFETNVREISAEYNIQ